MKKCFATLSAAVLVFATVTVSTALAADVPEKGLIAPAPLIAAQEKSAYRITVDGKDVGVKPAVMVPVRSLAEAMGFTVTWNSQSGAVTLDSGTMHSTLTIGRNVYLASTSLKDAVGMTAPFSLSAAPCVTDGITYVPIELFAVLMGNDPNAITVDGNTISIQTKTAAQIPNPLTEHATLDELNAAVGFHVQIPAVPEGYRVSLYQDIAGELAEVRFSNGTDTLTYRVSAGSEDNSGNWIVYADTKVIPISGSSVTCKGNDGLVNLATWTNKGYSYSLASAHGLSTEKMQEIIQSVCK